MKRYALIAATAATILPAAAMLPSKAGAMTLSTPAGLLGAAAQVNPAEHVWCNWRGCFGGPVRGYWGPTPWPGYPGYYPPPGFYRPWGYGWHRRWF